MMVQLVAASISFASELSKRQPAQEIGKLGQTTLGLTFSHSSTGSPRFLLHKFSFALPMPSCGLKKL